MKKIFAIVGILILLTGCSSEAQKELNDTSNQNVYKTIDYNSYSGDSNSTEFDNLINKKVTFTNVPTLGGTLGKLNKGISCRNESSFNIEDDAEYTVTGIVTSAYGTASISMKDCTITKN